MTTENTNTPTVAVVPVEKHQVTYKDVQFHLTRLATQGKGDKAQPIAYWGMDANQFSLPTTKDKEGKDVAPTDDANASHQVDMLAELVGWSTLRDMAYAKVNTNLKASQLEQGKDTYTMDDKAKYAIDYIMADWGVNSKGGGAAIKALKETNTIQGTLLAKLNIVMKELLGNPQADKVKLLAEMTTLQAELGKLTLPTLPTTI